MTKPTDFAKVHFVCSGEKSFEHMCPQYDTRYASGALVIGQRTTELDVSGKAEVAAIYSYRSADYGILE